MKRTSARGAGSFGAMMQAVHVLNGPNLNLLGAREPEIYGRETLDDIRKALAARCESEGLALVFKQSNYEGDLVTWVQEAAAAGAPIILNAGALTHSSIALHDAIKGARAEVVEVHLSNPQAREDFRHRSYVALAARGTISGFGATSYLLALEALIAGAKRKS